MFEFYTLYTSAHFHVQFKICTVLQYISLSPFSSSSSSFHELIHARCVKEKKNNNNNNDINKRLRNERRKEEEAQSEERKVYQAYQECEEIWRRVNRGGVGSPAINRGRSTSDFKNSSWCVKTHRGFRLPLFMLLDPRSSGGPGMSTVSFQNAIRT